MLKRTVWKGLLGVSAMAALFGAIAVHAQTAPGTTDRTQQPGTVGQGTTSTAGSKLNRTDQKIVEDMAQANMAEIAAAKLAQSKSDNEQVKNFALQMIDDHTKALNDVQQLAQNKGVSLPADLDSKHKAMNDKLGRMSGDAFNRAYLNQAGVSDHKKVHGQLLQAQARASDPDVKALAAKMLPTVEQHLNSAQQLHGAKSAKPVPSPTAEAGPKATDNASR